MSEDVYSTLSVSIQNGVATATIDNPPINLLDTGMIGDLDRLGQWLADNDDVRVVVLESANPDFFIAHADVSAIQQIPPPDESGLAVLAAFHQVVDRFRTMPRVTIAKIEGICRGGGSELVLACDMRFASIGNAVLSQPEVGIGIIPGGGGCARLPRLVGRGRALEIILGCADFDAGLAERYGYINRALASDEIGPFVDALATRIAGFPREAIANAKAVIAAGDAGLEDSLVLEQEFFLRAAHTDSAKRRMSRAMSLGLQTRAVETAGLEALWKQLETL